MRVDDERRRLKLPLGATRAVAVLALATGLYAASNEFYGGHSGSDFRSITAGEQKNRDYFDHFTMGDVDIELTGVDRTPGLDGTENILVTGRAMKDPTTVLSSGGWKFDMQSGEHTFHATLTILKRNADSVDVGFAAIIPSAVDGLSLNITHDVATDTGNGGVGAGAIRSIPLPRLDIQETSPNRT